MSSGLGGFLFGNIDEEGKLDNEDFDEVQLRFLRTFLILYFLRNYVQI